MKFTFLLLFTLLFFNQTAFSQDYSKMSANEKAKVIIYGNDYPYSLLLESGSDTLSVYVPFNKIQSTLIFEDGKLIQIIRAKDTSTYFYEKNRIVRAEQTIEGHYLSPFAYLPKYRNDSIIGLPSHTLPYYPMNQYFAKNRNEICCDTMNRIEECVYYKKNTIVHLSQKWIFYKKKVTCENMPSFHFPEKVDIQMNTFFIKDGYVHIIRENILTQEGYENEYCLTDFLMTEKHELRLRILKSPKDKPVREESMTIDEFLDKK